MPAVWAQTYASAGSLPLLLLALVVVAPIFEETLFRGFLFRGLAASREVLWQQALIRASLQGLEDVATADAAEVLFARSRRPATAGAFFDQLGEAALARGFAVARVSVLEERAFDTLDGLVRNLLLSLRVPGTSSRARGWAAVLDRFAAAHPSAAAAVAPASSTPATSPPSPA